MEHNEELFRAIIEVGFSKGDTSAIDDLAAPDFVEHQYGFDLPDATSVKRAIASLRGRERASDSRQSVAALRAR